MIGLIQRVDLHGSDNICLSKANSLILLRYLKFWSIL